jgi:serine/threonine protein kinase
MSGITFSIVVFSVAATMPQLHSLRIAHRDLKPTKILLNEKHETLLRGLIWSRFCTDSIADSITLGTSLFIAPELGQTGPTLEADVDAFGMLEDIVDFNH